MSKGISLTIDISVVNFFFAFVLLIVYDYNNSQKHYTNDFVSCLV